MKELRQLLVTLAMIACLLAIWAVIAAVAVYFEFIGTGLVLITGSLIAFVYHSARVFPYLTPYADDKSRYRWTTSDGDRMESCVEDAIVETPTTVSRTLRVSIYNRTKRKRLKRLMIGDDARYFGDREGGFWFLIRDRFHARKDGLLCVDRMTGEILFHLPKKQLEMDDQAAIEDALEAAQQVVRQRDQS